MGGGNASEVLQQAMLPVADHKTCSNRNKQLTKVYKGPMLCAGGHGKGGCQVKNENYELIFLLKIDVNLRLLNSGDGDTGSFKISRVTIQ